MADEQANAATTSEIPETVAATPASELAGLSLTSYHDGIDAMADTDLAKAVASEPVVEPEPVKPPEPAAPIETPPAEPTPETPETPAEPEPAKEPESVKGDDGSEVTKHFRLHTEGDPVRAEAFRLLKNNPKLGLAEADQLARQALGVLPVNPEPEAAKGPDPTVEIQAKIATLKAERKEAAISSDHERAIELEDQIDALKDELFAAKQAAAQSQVESKSKQEQEAVARVALAREEVAKTYPDLAKLNSTFTKEVHAIIEEWESIGATILNEPERCYLEASKRAQARLDVKSAAPQPAAAKSPAKPADASLAPPLATGGQRAATLPPVIDPVLAAVRASGLSLAEYEKAAGVDPAF